MHLISLTITNFGVYKGETIFSLSTNGGTIVLFGGKNGSGKTTILNAIRLCLYGAKALGSRTTKKEYGEYISQQIHRSKLAKVPIHSASVELKFEYTQLGRKNIYSINRTWKLLNTKNEVEEQLLIKENNELLKRIEKEYWQSFIDDLIPLSIFNLFFFDGEKISSLMIDNLSAKTLSVEIKRLLGLDLIERLQADLGIYLYQQRKRNNNTKEMNQLEILRNQKEEIKEKITIEKQNKARIVSSINSVSGQIEDLEIKIQRESNGYALDRERWKKRLIQIESEKEYAIKQIQGLSSDLLPFSLVPELLHNLKKQIILETDYQNWRTVRDSLEPKIKDIHESLEKDILSNGTHNIKDEDKQSIYNEISQLINELIEIPDEIRSVNVIHDFSDNERITILNWIDRSIFDLPAQSEEVFKRYSELNKERGTVSQALERIPSNEIIGPYIDQLNSLYKKLGSLEGQLIKFEERIHSLENEFLTINSEFTKSYQALRAEEKLELRLNLVQKTQQVLDKYIVQQTKRKLHSLEEVLVARFRELSRKENFVAKVTINEKDFTIKLYDSNDNEIPREQLSAGEQQMFAIAMIWALRQLSGRPFPVVIDTPLGRLDSDHRENLVNQYFPYVSHQVILFSTDTEVDKSYFKELQPYISHSYHLSYNSNQGATFVTEGYFWAMGDSNAIN